jgi:hypothetical protein
MTRDLPTTTEAKALAKRLRADLAAEGTPISHGEALERVAHGQGFRDWNAMHAAIRDLTPQGWSSGGRVTGRYLSQPFAATVMSAEQVRPGWFRLSLDLDEAVDVVRFESFSNLRKQIRVVVGPDGRSKERTSDGTPHLVLDR